MEFPGLKSCTGVRAVACPKIVGVRLGLPYLTMLEGRLTIIETMVTMLETRVTMLGIYLTRACYHSFFDLSNWVHGKLSGSPDSVCYHVRDTRPGHDAPRPTPRERHTPAMTRVANFFYPVGVTPPIFRFGVAI